MVKYQSQNGNSSNNGSVVDNGNGSFSVLALDRWLQVTISLTFLTFIAALIWYKVANRQNQKLAGLLPSAQAKIG